MGTFRHRVEVAADPQGPFTAMDAMVDTGTTYSQFPRSALSPLGVTAGTQREFTMADGRKIRRDLAIVWVHLDGQTLPTVCIVAPDGSRALLGAVTLETFGLTADPVNRRLVHAELYLLGTAEDAKKPGKRTFESGSANKVKNSGK